MAASVWLGTYRGKFSLCPLPQDERETDWSQILWPWPVAQAPELGSAHLHGSLYRPKASGEILANSVIGVFPKNPWVLRARLGDLGPVFLRLCFSSVT